MELSNLEKIYEALVNKTDEIKKETDLSRIESLSRALLEVEVDGTKAEKRKAFQFAYLKQLKDEAIQPNHQLTPDVIGYTIGYINNVLNDNKEVSLLDVGSGTGHLSMTLSELNPELQLNGVEIDSTLAELNANLCEFLETHMKIYPQNIIEPNFIETVDTAVGDLPVGYYPVQVEGYKTAFKEDNSFAHLLMIEAGMNKVKSDGIGIFTVPSNILTENQETLKKYIKEDVTLLMFLNLPRTIFKDEKSQKSIIVLKKGHESLQNKDVLIGDIPDFKDETSMKNFLRTIEEWNNK
ncbi:class I SAM-dependent methyltransferase [Nosocomiicoccus ampullae]|uniref:class I SAM-dependent methyltransferase n=1 Tax=Nosocomiicoccus ampullae TaxID=489910 RepID=UPI001C5EE30B|nr:class I SAM-dependent methyltransferase [Nosocomiicoccus ampullae]QYA47852.1 class I SAM-dependent methyltransferase [Nosocomiicoccus ampullae]